MARWHLASNRVAHHVAEGVCARAGLHVSGAVANEGCFGAAYAKRAVPVANFATEGEDWICVAGTLVYDGGMGIAPLRAALRDFLAGGIQAVRAKAIGHYALAVQHGGVLTVFTDPEGAHHCYYSSCAARWAISTSLQACTAMAFAATLNPDAFWVTICQTATAGAETLYREVRRLFGTEQLHADIQRSELRVERVDTAPLVGTATFRSIGDAVEDYAGRVREVFRQLSALGEIGLFGTGGMDSRTILAGLLDCGAKPTMLYGVGSGRLLTDDDPRDLATSQLVARASNLHHVQLDWRGEYPHSVETLRGLFARYGFQYEIYGAPRSMLQSFEAGVAPGTKLLLGGYCPAFTNYKPWERTVGRFALDEVIEFWLPREVQAPSFRRPGAYRDEYRTQIQDALRRTGVQLNGEREAFVQAVLLLYLRPESRFLNFANEFMPYVAPFITHQLFAPLLEVPLAFRVADEFQVRLIHALSPDLLDLPIYSGHVPGRFDMTNLRLERKAEVEERSMLGRLADVALPRRLHEPVWQFYRRFRSDTRAELRRQRTNERVKTAYRKVVMADPMVNEWITSAVDLNPKMLTRLLHYLIGDRVLSELRHGKARSDGNPAGAIPTV